ncbi:MAG: riboflavin biosynthesis protein RibF [Candidatus Humimicrobiaceae bacterium]
MARKLKLNNISKDQFSGLDPVMVIGFFDGVHKGHQKIINMCKDSSDKKGAASIILTFDRPPLNVVKSRTYKKLIFPFEEKLKILEDTGVDFIITAEISPEFLKLSPECFCKDILLGIFGVKELFIGEGFRFGYRASGDVGLLKSCLEPSGVKVNEVRLLGSDVDAAISSTTIRDYYAEGNISKIRNLLGRDPYINGVVVKGAGRGKGLGFPTANLDVCDTLVVPRDGVYFGTVSIMEDDGSLLPAIINIGDNPTFGISKKWIEAYILDFDKRIYDKEIKIKFLDRHRDEVKFNSSDELIDQIRKDVRQARNFFKEKT